MRDIGAQADALACALKQYRKQANPNRIVKVSVCSEIEANTMEQTNKRMRVRWADRGSVERRSEGIVSFVYKCGNVFVYDCVCVYVRISVCMWVCLYFCSEEP